MGLYEFKPEDAYEFARHMGIKTFESHGKLHFQKCPMCNKMTNDKKTFAINLKTGQFKCLRETCGYQGNMLTLSKDFDFSLGSITDEYYKPRKKFRTYKTPEKPIEPKPPAIAYLQSRGIGEEVAKKYQITTKAGQDNILVFPFYDEKGRLDYIKYRKTDFNKERDSNKEWCESDSKPILFGMYQCNLQNKTLVITEGQMDSLSLAQAGIENAVSVPNGAKGFTWVSYCWDWVNNFDTIIVFGDYEKGNISLLDELQQRFSRLRIKHVREEAYKDCKDANDLLRKYGVAYLRTCVETAVDVPIKQIIELSKVADVNIYDIEKMKSGIKDLDQMLYGGLFFGGVTIITGKSGKGKSSFASQIIANALEQGYKCFAYSGELANHLFKAWLDYQLAGKNHIQTYTTRFGMEGYRISDTNKALIKDWYKENIYIYDSSAIEDEVKDLVSLVEEVITRYGVRVILIDNLMTALDLDINRDTDKYERQSKFVKALVRIAMRFDVLILLVAHKRKNTMYGSEESDDVSGSSDITNLGSITLSYDVGTKKEIEQGEITAQQRKLKLLKNRVFGVVYPDGWVLDFEPKSKRIYGEHDDPNFEYGWTKGLDNGFDAVPNEQEIPW